MSDSLERYRQFTGLRIDRPDDGLLRIVIDTLDGHVEIGRATVPSDDLVIWMPED